MKKLHASPKLKQRAYMERKRAKHETAAEEADERFQCSKFDLRFFGESGFDQKRTWDALLVYEFTSVGVDTWIPMFNPTNQTFDGGPNPGHGYVVRGAMNPDWFDTHWVPPKNCDGNEVIDRENLKSLPPIQQAKKPEPKPSPRVPVTVDASLVSGYETPLEERERLHDFATFGVTRGLPTA